ncbi:uncharacterized protein LOC142776279 isoform X2 [Rhipicephalus microplus]|uniref:uncharacterized protein LOC142776279 isoform X2 n=1 Tax=Rhipicephalus microplus TaxID=6941 RepID=UPI003F6B9F47
MGREKWPPKRARLCEDHFTIYQFEEDSLAGRKRLKPAAVPSIFCAHQSAIVSDNSRSSMAPDKSEEAGLSPSKLGGTGAQQSVDTSQHSLPASQATVIPAKSDRVLCLEHRLDLEQKRWRKAEKESANCVPFKSIHKRPTCKSCTCFCVCGVDKQAVTSRCLSADIFIFRCRGSKELPLRCNYAF